MKTFSRQLTLGILVGTLELSAWGQTQSSSSATPPPPPPVPDTGSRMAPESKNATNTRNFYQVLEDVLGDFEYDLKNGNVHGTKDMAFRYIVMSENVPASFKQHLELLLTERILRQSKGRIIQCLQCKTKKATLSGDNVVISSPESNPAEMSRIAKVNGIINFADVSFSFQPSAMIMSLYITDAETGSVTFSRSYNSETSRAALLRRGVDISQVEGVNKAALTPDQEYKPTNAIRPTFYYLFEKNLEEYTGVIVPGFRMVERYANRKREVGFELNYMKDPVTLIGGTAKSTNLYGGTINLTLLFMYAWNLIGDIENYNTTRGSLFLGIGGTYASGYLGSLIRSGYEWRLGKHWAVIGVLGYRPAGTAILANKTQVSVSGAEFGLGVAALF